GQLLHAQGLAFVLVLRGVFFARALVLGFNVVLLFLLFFVPVLLVGGLGKVGRSRRGGPLLAPVEVHQGPATAADHQEQAPQHQQGGPPLHGGAAPAGGPRRRQPGPDRRRRVRRPGGLLGRRGAGLGRGLFPQRGRRGLADRVRRHDHHAQAPGAAA